MYSKNNSIKKENKCQLLKYYIRSDAKLTHGFLLLIIYSSLHNMERYMSL